MQPFQLTLSGHITPADKARNDYFYLPFDLPTPAQRLHLRYHYSDPMSSDQVEGGNVIDIGLFDPRCAAFPGGAGFRGWSGSARQEFTITLEDATPGYLPGPLPAGRYQVILGLYRIWPQGATYTVEITAELVDEPPDELPDAPPAWPTAPVAYPLQATGPATQWLCGDLQSHTFHSDAKGSPAQLVAKARAAGFDFLAVTDHNTISHHIHLPALADERLILIPSQEVTTYYGHMNVWGARNWCDFRCKEPEALTAIIELAHRHGGVCSINHPKEGGPAWEYGFELPVDTIEVWQGPWPYRNAESLALWDRLLCAGRRWPAVGGSDYHCPSGEDTNLLRLGQPTTWVKVREHSVTGILDALCAGRSCISAHPQGPRVAMRAQTGAATAGMGETLQTDGAPVTIEVTTEVWRGQGYQLQLVADGQTVFTTAITATEAEIRTPVTAQHYVRAEVVGDAAPAQLPPQAPSHLDRRDWRWALSNPIYLQTA
ncbi:MAG: CehA/McbA family metallohydrolase [Caldilineaceae bacterium]